MDVEDRLVLPFMPETFEALATLQKVNNEINTSINSIICFFNAFPFI